MQALHLVPSFNLCPSLPPQSFLLKVESTNPDGGASVITSVPCSAGVDTELCMVEVRDVCTWCVCRFRHMMTGLQACVQFVSSSISCHDGGCV